MGLDVVTIARARRWMTAGLVVSIIGTRVVEGASNGAVADDLFPVFWVAVLATVGKLLSFAAPVIARCASSYSPARVLILSDFVESGISLVALVGLWAAPTGMRTPILLTYFIVVSIFPAITDVVEEFFAQQVAQLDPDQALKFNTTIYSMLAFVGIVIGMPIGSAVAGVDVTVVVAFNAVASLIGVAFRFVSSTTVLVGPITEQDPSAFKATGTRMSFSQFVADLRGSGPASPVIAFLMQAGGTACGVYLYLAVANSTPWRPAFAMAVVLCAFGLGATLGPWSVPAMKRRFGLARAVMVSYGGLVALLVVLVANFVLHVTWGWLVSVAVVFLMGVVSRVRAVLTTTLRQTEFRGARFSRLMSWGMAAGAAGGILGNWLGVALEVASHPILGMCFYAAVTVASGSIVGRSLRPRAEQAATAP